MELSEGDKKVLANVHQVFYQAGLIKSPELAQLGLQFTQVMQRLTTPTPTPPANPKQELFKKVAEEKKGKG